MGVWRFKMSRGSLGGGRRVVNDENLDTVLWTLKTQCLCHKPHLQRNSYKMTIAREERDELLNYSVNCSLCCGPTLCCAGRWLAFLAHARHTMYAWNSPVPNDTSLRSIVPFYTCKDQDSARVSVCGLCSYCSGEAGLTLRLIFPLKIRPRGLQPPLGTLCPQRGEVER